MLDWAMAYLRLGLPTIPMVEGGKHPHVRWREYQTQAVTLAMVEEWWTQWPDAGIGVLLGAPSNLLMVDVDSAEASRILAERVGLNLPAPTAKSGSEDIHRRHLYFRHPEHSTKACATPWHPQLEFRGDRGLGILPPSLHASGRRYAWEPGRSILQLDPPELPSEIADTLRHCQRRRHAVPTQVVESLPQSRRPTLMPGGLTRATEQFLSGQFANGPRWNDRLFNAACDLRGLDVPSGQARTMLLCGARPWNQSEREIAIATIESAYSEARLSGRDYAGSATDDRGDVPNLESN